MHLTCMRPLYYEIPLPVMFEPACKTDPDFAVFTTFDYFSLQGPEKVAKSSSEWCDRWSLTITVLPQITWNNEKTYWWTL